MQLWEIFVPTVVFGKEVEYSYHRDWDLKVIKIVGGLTILRPVRGKWAYNSYDIKCEEMIPVRIACELSQIRDIAKMTAEHYKQKSVMYYLISKGVEFYTV